ncbi:MAG: phosphatidylserine decarboxylase family protein [Flavobacteriia bacterium]|uniref:phosphatidylserine decarboxylase family protein n=1 Tax=uncultured Flavobacterium sp. TaxID=165435 RepID=UPI00095EE0C1|nr:phosphatidylserine decarboxylase family protein [uncultured Flavobacterium sp.]MBN9292802.1 phosphatidylserine decarboxylase family protein [Flavobacteriia bacterium]OJX37105.1 MAG: phosphatidylserine decarboxylase [Flavobacteriia bacterium 40-80]
MKIHREGYTIILVAALILGALFIGNIFLYKTIDIAAVFWLINLTLLVFFYLVVQFFRVPNINESYTDNEIVCPADGKIVVIEEAVETEYFKDKRIQISIFMSPLNVHANFNPISGIIRYVRYHAGLFLVAWHPKSSTDNERSTIVIEHPSGQEVLFRQIAGAVARRICFYVKEGQKAEAGQEFGFIKFGSRIDVFLPLGTQIDVKIGDIVKGRLTRLGKLN